jgi:ankyrin repeat protein
MPNNKKKKRKAKSAGTRQRSAAEINQALVDASMHNVLSSNDANVMSAQAAIDAGADVDSARDGLSCLMFASIQGYAKMVALLLNAGADTETKGEKGATALFVAAEHGHAKCIELLLNAGADKEARGE